MSDADAAKALFFEALDLMDARDLSGAEARLREALRLLPANLSVLTNLAVVLLRRGKAPEARRCAEKALALKPHNVEALLVLVECDLGDKRNAEALASCDAAIGLEPSIAEAHNNRGLALARMGRFTEAVQSYDKAVLIRPDFAEAYSNRGTALRELKQFDPALVSYEKALFLNDDLAEAWLGRGNLFVNLQRHENALAAYEKALSIKADLAEAWLGRGEVFSDNKRYDDAVAAYDQALSIKADLAEAWLGRGNVFSHIRRHDDAFAAYDMAVSIKPDLRATEGARLHAKMRLCKWENLETEINDLRASVRAGKANSHPFAFLSLTDSPDEHLRCAQAWVEAERLQSSTSTGRSPGHAHDKIRIGYVSPDFRTHPVGYLTAGLFENHDMNRFETCAFSIGPGDDSVLRHRLEKSFSCFIDLDAKSDSEIIGAINSAEVDVLVDLAGYTQDARPRLWGHRAAPIVVNYLGFPGTLGSSRLWDYIITDKVVTPDGSQQFFEEKFAFLPNCFMPHDDKGREISDTRLNRADHGLPEKSFVFCCFNNAYKINPEVFECWMRILKSVDGSVLWLADMAEAANANLRQEAKERGVDPDRLVFARRLASSAEHLARHRLADLFLDTLPYNAHTTASDALWAGLPVLTQIGSAFAGRVAASLLDAIGLPELITRSRKEYESLAIALALDRDRMQAIRGKLAINRLATSVFDTATYTRRLEAAYEAMYRRHKAGLPPDHIEISA